MSSEAAARLNDTEWLRDQYLHEGRSLSAIGAELGVARFQVHQALHRAGIPCRTSNGSRSDGRRDRD